MQKKSKKKVLFSERSKWSAKIITMISSFFGIAIVALPAGIVTAGYIEEVQHMNK